MPAKFDIHFQLLGAGEQVESNKVFSFGFVNAVGVRGPQKLINRWLKCLMTPKGSDPFNKAYGTVFSELIGSNIGDVQDAVDVLMLAIDDCNQQIRAIDRRNLSPDDERLQNATLSSVRELGRDGFEAYVNIRNAAGLIVTTALPTIATR